MVQGTIRAGFPSPADDFAVKRLQSAHDGHAHETVAGAHAAIAAQA
jgi:hypothetical protein